MLGLALAAGVVFWWSRGRLADPPAALGGAAATNPPPAPVAAAPFQRLVGRWVRPDGGYVVEIRSVDAGGTVEAAYFNPRPIHVARAEAKQEGEALRLFIELRDVNYPGSTYDLRYDPGRDVLAGVYFQALQRQTFDVSFVRR